MKLLGNYSDCKDSMTDPDQWYLVYNEHVLFFCKYDLDNRNALLYNILYELINKWDEIQVKISLHDTAESTYSYGTDILWELTDEEVYRHIIPDFC